jgi:hypothetical protein
MNTTQIKPDGRTVFGVICWSYGKGRLTWEGPGARVMLRKPGPKSRSGGESLGASLGHVSEPCGSLAAAQRAVDAYVSGN